MKRVKTIHSRSTKNELEAAPHVPPGFDSFFDNPVDPRVEAREVAVEVIRRLLVWIAEGSSLEERGLRTSVALFCVRPDLIDGATLEQIGDLSGRSRQAVHKLAANFRLTIGLVE